MSNVDLPGFSQTSLFTLMGPTTGPVAVPPTTPLPSLGVTGAPLVLRGPGMRVARFRYGTDLQAGAFQNTAFDTVINASRYGHAAIQPIPATTYTAATGAQALGTPQPPAAGLPTFSITNTQGLGAAVWQLLESFAYTYQAGDAIAFTTTARAVQIQLAGSRQAGAGLVAAPADTLGVIRNGAIAAILVDGAVQQSIDTANAAPLAQLYLDGASHTVQVVHSGSYSTAIQPIGPVTATASAGGQSVAAQLVLRALAHPTFAAALWRVTATSATQYSLYKTVAGAAEALIASGLVSGTHYTGAASVPGVDLSVATGSALVVGDGATFSTDVVTLAVESIATGSSGGAGSSAYTTPVMDAGDPQTQWFLAEWDQAPGLVMGGVTAYVGQTPTPDVSWATTTAVPTGAMLPSGRGYGVAGLAGVPPVGATPRGRYCVLTFTFPAVATVAPWIRDPAVYAWTPERDPQILSKTGLVPDEAAVGPRLGAYVGTLAATTTELRQDVYDFVGSYAISGAVDQYLDAYGAARQIPRYTAEPPQAYRTRLLSASATRVAAASIPGLCQQIAQLVTGASSGLATSVSGGYMTATCQGVVVAQAAGKQAPVTIPAPPYAGLSGLTVAQAQTLISQFLQTVRPVGTVFFPNNTGSLVTFL